MKEVLGVPHKENEGQYCYVFADACIQIDAQDRSTIDAVSVGIRTVGWRNHFQLWPMRKLVIGKTSFKDVVEDDDAIEHSSSSKHFHFYVVKYYGFPGFYWTYAMGFLECPGVLPGDLDWFPSQNSKDEIPAKLKINWGCVTRLKEPPPFNYYGFL